MKALILPRSNTVIWAFYELSPRDVLDAERAIRNKTILPIGIRSFAMETPEKAKELVAILDSDNKESRHANR